jgi:hypothetical protein
MLKVIVFCLGSSLVIIVQALCTSVFKHAVEHYINRGSHVFVCFIKFSKAFDKVNYWKILNKLLDDNIDISFTRVLA